MLERLKKEQEQFYKQAIVPIFKNYISHAYFIETNHNEENLIKNYIKEFCKILFLQGKKNWQMEKKEHLENLIEHDHFPDLIEIFPLNNVIRKEQLLQVKEKFQNKSMYDTYQIYVIYEAEKLNVNAANTILKFLEEPEDNIIGIFVADNRYRVINTILSRCSIFSLKQEEISFDFEQLSSSLFSFFENIIERKKSPLMLEYMKYQAELFNTKENALKNMNDILFLFKGLWNHSLKNQKFEEYQNQLTKEELLEIIDILEKEIYKLRYNVNLKLWLDELLLMLMEVKN